MTNDTEQTPKQPTEEEKEQFNRQFTEWKGDSDGTVGVD